MHCPRCGEQAHDGDRFCVTCGEELTAPGSPTPESRSLGDRVRGVMGRDRRSRILTAGIVVALAVAVAAFFVLDAGEEEIPRDDYTIAVDEICVQGKQSLAAAAQRAVDPEGPGTRSSYAAEIVDIVTGWRSALAELRAPADRLDQSGALDAALREVATESAALARVARGNNEERLVEQAGATDAATAQAEAAIEDLGLSDCAEIVLLPPAPMTG